MLICRARLAHREVFRPIAIRSTIDCTLGKLPVSKKTLPKSQSHLPSTPSSNKRPMQTINSPVLFFCTGKQRHSCSEVLNQNQMSHIIVETGGPVAYYAALLAPFSSMRSSSSTTLPLVVKVYVVPKSPGGMHAIERMGGMSTTSSAPES